MNTHFNCSCFFSCKFLEAELQIDLLLLNQHTTLLLLSCFLYAFFQGDHSLFDIMHLQLKPKKLDRKYRLLNSATKFPQLHVAINFNHLGQFSVVYQPLEDLVTIPLNYHWVEMTPNDFSFLTTST